jgi:hypothetical protein
MNGQAGFYDGLPVFRAFDDLADPALYRPLPADWWIGLSDVVHSTQAIAAGRYKVVNVVGAAPIAALTNALQRREFPFAFGGDGASFAVPPENADAAREALAATAAWARDEFDLALRTALVPVDAIREAGFDVRVARFAPSPHVSYAMFSGGGLAWAERALKEGRFAVPPGPEGARPDLTGLSCRWEEIRASRGVILSLVLVPVENGEEPAYRALVRDLLRMAEGPEAARSPVPEGGPTLGAPTLGLEVEARVGRRRGANLALARLMLLLRRSVAWLVFRIGRPLGGFDPQRYRGELAANSDFRKYDDGLRLTLDCTPALADALERRLEAAEAAGIARFGLHRQPAAIMTCITPSVQDSRHVHFVDGAAGGYASAAARLKLARSGA